MRTLLFFLLALLFSCSDPDSKKEVNHNDSKPLSNSGDSLANLEPLKHKPVRIDSADKMPLKSTGSKGVSKTTNVRYFEGVNDDKLNGQPILIQMDLPESRYKKNTDTIQECLNGYYKMAERFFPRSIADDFEKGVSTEQIHYPTLHFKVELFENEFANKPYKVVERTIFNEKDKNEMAKKTEEPVQNWAEEMPSVLPEKQHLKTYLQNHILPPAKIKEKGISGISWLTFIVEKDGSISDLRIEKKFENCTECDDEALRVAKSFPLLNPGLINKQAVRVRIHQGINF